MKSKGFNKQCEAYLFLLPWILGLLLFTVIPMAMSLYFSFTQYDAVTAPRFIGLDNYVQMANDRRVHKSLQVTFTYVGLSIPFQLAFALFLATILKKNRRGSGCTAPSTTCRPCSAAAWRWPCCGGSSLTARA